MEMDGDEVYDIVDIYSWELNIIYKNYIEWSRRYKIAINNILLIEQNVAYDDGMKDQSRTSN
jgi:hypothetical protein